jgi:arylsulfatase A-like enzyme
MPYAAGVDYCQDSIRGGIPVMGEVFRDAGYETAWAGKWHLPQSYPNADEFGGFENLRLPPGTPASRGADADEPVVERALEFLRRPHEQPFLLSVALHNPHDICHHIHEIAARAGGILPIDALPPLPPNFGVSENEPEFIQACRARTTYGAEIRSTVEWGDVEWRLYLHTYYRLVEKADALIGRVLDEIEMLGLRDDTLIVFTSDHGEGMAAHLWVVKLMLWEEVVRVPLIFAGPGVVRQGYLDDASLTSGADILPSLCDCAGITPPPTDGVSVWPTLTDRARRVERDFVVAELQPDWDDASRRGRMLRAERYKYCAFSHGENSELLFDLEKDPGESSNLARDSNSQEILKHHRQLLASWCRRTGDVFVTA